MKPLLLAFAIMILTNTVEAADKPNFSGEWKMNSAKSHFGDLPAPDSFTRKIAHVEPEITIVEEQIGQTDATNGTVTKKLTTDGQSVSFDSKGAPAIASIAWDGSDLIAVTTLDVYGLEFRERMSLSNDGKVLTSKGQVTTSQRTAEFTIVFDRQ